MSFMKLTQSQKQTHPKEQHHINYTCNVTQYRYLCLCTICQDLNMLTVINNQYFLIFDASCVPKYLQEATAILISATWPQMYFYHYINTIGLIGELNVVPNSNLPGLIMLRYFVYCICIIIHSTLQITIYMSHFCLQIAGASRGGQRFKGTAVSYRLK